LLRGNVVDLAVAVVIGTAFGAVVAALVRDLVTPLIAAVGGEPDFGALSFTLNRSQFRYGDFLNALIAFVIIAAVVYFLIVLPFAALLQRIRKQPPPNTKKCPECLSDVPSDARRCAFCASQLELPSA
jgi:large conductance mechanosensitive channel